LLNQSAPSKLTIVTGIPGVGKSTVCAAIAEARDLRVWEFGEEMAAEGIANGSLSDYADLERLALPDRIALQSAVAERIAVDRPTESIVAAHLVVSAPEGFVPGLPLAVLRKLAPVAIVLLSAPVAEVRRRRPDGADETVLASHATVLEIAAVKLSTDLEVPLSIVANVDGALAEAVALVSSVLPTS
jgi:adenylate kinase